MYYPHYEVIMAHQEVKHLKGTYLDHMAGLSLAA
jgi:hypothetical protein